MVFQIDNILQIEMQFVTIVKRIKCSCNIDGWRFCYNDVTSI